VQLEDGRCEFLAVAPIVAGAAAGGNEAGSSGAGAGAQAGSGDGPTASVTQEANAVPTASTPVLEAEVLPLPYPLPE